MEKIFCDGLSRAVQKNAVGECLRRYDVFTVRFLKKSLKTENFIDDEMKSMKGR